VLVVPQRQGVLRTARDESAESLGGVEAEPLALALQPHRGMPPKARHHRPARAVRDCADERVVEVGARAAPTVRCEIVADHVVRRFGGDVGGGEEAGGAGEAGQAEERSHPGDGSWT